MSTGSDKLDRSFSSSFLLDSVSPVLCLSLFSFTPEFPIGPFVFLSSLPSEMALVIVRRFVIFIAKQFALWQERAFPSEKGHWDMTNMELETTHDSSADSTTIQDAFRQVPSVHETCPDFQRNVSDAVVHRHRNHLLTSVDDEKKKKYTCGTVKCTGLVVSHMSARQLLQSIRIYSGCLLRKHWVL